MILNDVSSSQNPQQISEKIIDKSVFDNYTLTFVDSLADGTYTISIEDDAGNKVLGSSSNEQTFVIDGSAPIFPSAVTLGSTDKGRYTDDRLTNIKKPVVKFNSETNLRVFLDRDGTKIDVSDYSVLAEINGDYTLTFENKELIDGTYTITIEDPAGNAVKGTSLPFIIETQKANIICCHTYEYGTDTGVSGTDRLSNMAKPEVTFSSETGLRIFVDHITSNNLGLETRTTLVGNTGPKKVYDLVQDQFGTMASGKYALLSESGGYKLEKVELDETTTSVANDYKLTAATDDTITIASSDTTNVTAIQNYLAGKKVYNLTADQFGTTTGDQGAGAYIIEATGGGAYKLDKVELDATTASVTNDYKLTSATDDTVTVGATDTAIVTAIQTFLSGALPSLGTLGAASSVGTFQTASDFQYNYSNGNYSVNFVTGLTDGKYEIYSEDDAGNISDITNDQSFVIDRTSPLLPKKIVLTDNTDTGRSTSDLLTNLAKPQVTFTTEAGLRVFVQRKPWYLFNRPSFKN